MAYPTSTCTEIMGKGQIHVTPQQNPLIPETDSLLRRARTIEHP
jgi:hypothetical protein